MHSWPTGPHTGELHRTVDAALDDWTIIRPLTCSKCGASGKIVGHHEDYSKPLDIEWLCVTCHRRRHNELYLEKQRNKNAARQERSVAYTDTCAICGKELVGRGTKRKILVGAFYVYICYGAHRGINA